MTWRCPICNRSDPAHDSDCQLGRVESELGKAQERVETLEGALREIADSSTGCVAGHSAIAGRVLTPEDRAE